MTPTDHPPREKLEKFLAGRVRPGEGARAVVRHLLSGCEQCTRVARQRLGFGSGGGAAGGATYAASVASVRRKAGKLAREVADEQAAAPELVAELLGHPHLRQLTILRNHRRFQSVALVKELCAASHGRLGSQPAEAVQLARLAVVAADALPAARYPRELINDFRCRARVYLANALRIGADLMGSRQAFAQARLLFNEGSRDRLELAYLIYNEAVLIKDEGRFEEALRQMLAAFRLYRDQADFHLAGKVMVDAALVKIEMGRPAEAAGLLSQAATLIDPGREPGLIVALYHNLAYCYCETGCLDAALSLLVDARPLYEELGSPANRMRLSWLEGRVLARKLRFGEAAARFEEARDGFLQIELLLEAALVSLELATAYAERQWVAQARRLIAETLAICRAKGLHREALAALTFLRKSVEEEGATVAVIQRVHRFLETLQRDPEVKWASRRPQPGS